MKKPSSEFFESSSIQSSDERIEVSQFLLSFFMERTNWGGANMHKCSVISGSLVQKASLAAETTSGEILVAFWPKHDLRSNLKSAFS